MELIASKEMQKYFEEIDSKVKSAYSVAAKARKQGYDPEKEVAVPLAKNMAERVEGLISTIAPMIANSGLSKRIKELEKEFGDLDWRVALKISLEVAQEKICKFDNRMQAIETGIRVGLAYLTLGIVASPIEGFVELKVRKRKDGKEYLAIRYSGPIRSAGGTAAAVSVIVSDYVRKNMGYAPYDPTEEEVQRLVTELYDYHERVTNLQYLPSRDEIAFLMRNIPIQIDGDPSEEVEVSQFKDLARIETNRIRSGPCLVIGEGIAQKAPKLWKQLSKWGKEFGLDEWMFIKEFIDLQKKVKSKSVQKTGKVAPIYTYIEDLVAGRPVLTHPLRAGGFRLRYGRSRVSGYSSASIHPALTYTLQKYLATGTQLKVERPGKAASLSCCDSIEGPVVKLKTGDVLRVETTAQAKKLMNEVEEILFLGDILFNYGDFFNRAHVLLPPGYCEEWWVQELEKSIVDTFGTLALDKLSELTNIPLTQLESLLKDPLKNKLNPSEIIQLSLKLGIPLHPYYTFHWDLITQKDLLDILNWLHESKVVIEEEKIQKIILPFDKEKKRAIELIGLPHKVVGTEYIIIEKEEAPSIVEIFNLLDSGNFEKTKEIIKENKDKKPLEIINIFSKIKLRDKSGYFIGARMGRPEKAKVRKLAGSPHVLFPVGEEGGKLRCFQSAIEAGKVTSDFSLYQCEHCKKETVFSVCETCNKPAKKTYFCKTCGIIGAEECQHGKASPYKRKEINIKHLFEKLLEKLDDKTLPDLIKGVRGTSNKEHIPEHLLKGILRAKHEVYVNKDGTTRYDMTQLPITHFKPKEIQTSVERLKELGYEKDIYGKEITGINQILELKPQDVILPSCDDSPEEGADKILFRTAKFIDELLAKLYHLEPFYNLKSEKDLAGSLVVALAPHTSAGIVARIIGFSKTQGFFAHPMIHAATRRDCFVYSSKISVYNKTERKWLELEIGKFVESFKPSKKADNYGTLVKEINDYYTMSLNPESKKLELSKIHEVSAHTPSDILELTLEDGRILKLTSTHSIFTKGLVKKRANCLKQGDQLVIPYKTNIKERDLKNLDLLGILRNSKGLMVRNSSKEIYNLVKKAGGRKKFRELYGLKKSELDNYLLRDSFPLKLSSKLKIAPKKIGFIRGKISVNSNMPLGNDFFYLIGLYIAEGFARKKDIGKGYYQISIAATEKEIREDIIKIMKKYFNLNPSENHIDHLTFSSRILYELFVDYFKLGNNAHNKNINFFLDLEKEKLSYLLKGYLDGDGSVSLGDLKVTFDTVSRDLINNMRFVFGRYGIFISSYKYKKQPGPKVRQFYLKKARDIPEFEITKLKVSSKFVSIFNSSIGFKLKRKQSILKKILKDIKPKYNKIEFDNQFAYPKIMGIKHSNQKTYCLNIEKNHNFLADGVLVHNCDGDEASVSLLLDILINFSRKFLPNSRGATQDAPLVLTSYIIPSEVDDMVFDLDICKKYPLEFYDACLNFKQPWDVVIEQLGKRLNKETQYEGMWFTHHTDDINSGVRCSAYKTLPSMEEKLKGQMELAEKIRAVDTSDVARLVIEKHFIRDIKGNLRKFSQQMFRCVNCNEKYRRPPLVGKCIKCGGKVIFTISEGSIVKYLEPAISLAAKYDLPAYLKQSLELTKRRVEGVFGKDKEKQAGLGQWFG
ncbi:MAG: DNA polymerase II large subunit [Nanoarchaeota archaeon]|nr:DNA polymerase II large subunit [Nanoarchaeota archaeon]MBU1004234.1 DNA polymerase II large subunit [Nanoarchaeota archaeon]